MKYLSVLVALGLLWPCMVAAQMTEETLGKMQELLTAQVQSIYWQNARGFNGEVLPPPEGAQQDIYLIPTVEEKYTVMAGMNTAKFRWCGLDADGYFKEFMKRQKGRGMWSAYQMSYISLLASSAEGFTSATMLKDMKCSDPVKRELQEGYDKALALWEKKPAATKEKKE